MAFVYNREDGKLIEVNDQDPALTEKISKGDWAFPKGLDIPVKDEHTGEIGYVPSENAQTAFQKGFRWSTPADSNADSAQKLEDIKAKAYDDPQTALEAAAVNSLSFGLTKSIMDQQGPGNAMEELAARNPKATMAGNIIGAVANPLLGAAGKAAKEATTGSTAAQIAGKYAAPTLGSAAEGAVFGLHGAMTENALGNPHELATHILLGTGAGGVLGAGGELLGIAAPYIKGLSKSVAGKVEEGVTGASQAAQETAGSAVLRARGLSDSVPDLKTMVRDAEGRAVVEEAGGVKGVEKLEAEADKGITQLTKDQVGIQRDLDRVISRAPREEAEALKSVISENKGDLAKIAEDLNGRMKQVYANEEESILSSSAQDHFYPVLIQDAQRLAETLKKTGVNTARILGQDIEATVNSSLGDSTASLADTYKLRKALKSVLGSENSRTISKLNSPEARDAVLTFLKGPETAEFDEVAGRYIRDTKQSPLWETGAGHEDFPEYAKSVARMETAYKAVKDFGRVLTNNAKDAGSLVGALASPEGKVLLSTLPDRVPEIEAIMAKTGSALEKKAAVDRAVTNFNEAAAKMGESPISADRYEQIISELQLNQKITPGSVDKLRSLETLDATTSNSPLDRWVQVQKALGKDISPIMKRLSEADPTVQAMKRLDQLPKWSSKILDAGSKYGYLAGPKTGMAFNILNKLTSAATNPVTLVDTLAKIERTANAGVRALDSAVGKAVDAVTSPAIKRAAISSIAGSMSKQKKDFPKQVEILAKYQDPHQAADIIASKTANLSRAPQVAAALGQKSLETANFLYNKLPQDPLAGFALPGVDSKWQPSDAELSKFNRYVAAAENPLSVVENVASGTVSPEEVETLKVLHPTVYEKLQTSILTAITEKGQNVSYQKRILLGTLFDVPTDISLRPDFMGKMQQLYAQQEPENQGGRPEGRSIKIDLDPMKNVATETTRITNK